MTYKNRFLAPTTEQKLRLIIHYTVELTQIFRPFYDLKISMICTDAEKKI